MHLFRNVCKQFLTILDKFQYFQTNFNTFKQFLKCSDKFQHLQILQKHHRQVAANENVYKKPLMYISIFDKKCARIFSSISKLIFN